MEAQKYPLSSSFLVSHPSWQQLLSTVVDPTAKVSSLVRGSCSREEGACVIWLMLPTTSPFKFLPPKETRPCSFQILKKKKKCTLKNGKSRRIFNRNVFLLYVGCDDRFSQVS